MLVLSLICVTFIRCCEREEDYNPPTQETNVLKIGKEEYKLTGGVLINNGQDPSSEEDKLYEGYELNLLLYSEGVTIYPNGEGEGTGTIITFATFSSTDTHLDNATYTMATAVPPYEEGMFFAGYQQDWSEEKEDEDALMIRAGSLTVSRRDKEYKITFDCKDINGKTVTGSYAGSLLYFDGDEI